MLSSKASAESGRWKNSRTPYLVEIMDCLSPSERYEEVIFMAGAQLGKPLTLDTTVPTPCGFKKMKDIHSGDLVFGTDGKPCRVLGESPVFLDQDCYEITFDDGSKIKADYRHLWTVERQRVIGKSPWQEVTITTEVMSEKWKTKDRHLFRIKIAKPLEIEEKKLEIDPYTLGVWLGDGHSYSSLIHCGAKDAEEIASKIKGHQVEIRKEDRGVKVLHIDKDPNGRKNHNEFCKSLRKYNLLKNKHIPDDYLFSDFNTRSEVLKGLMDTDGHCGRGSNEIVSKWEHLADQIRFLLASVGYKSVKKSKFVNGVEYYRVTFRSYKERSVYKLKRKHENQRSEKQSRPHKTGFRYVTDVKKINKAHTKCIAVDSKDHLFLVGDTLIATHNTECGNNWLGYIIHKAPGPTMIVQPTQDMADKFSDQRIEPLIDETPVLRALVSDRRARDSTNTKKMKTFRGGVMAMVGSNSPTGLRSLPIRYLFMDEISAYSQDCGGEGSPMKLAKARTRTFARRKILYTSTPTEEGRCNIEAAYLETDQNRYFVPCPECEEMQWLQWCQVSWETDEFKKPILSSVRYICEHCKAPIPNYKKTWMLERGEWRATVPENASRKKIGFHISSLYSPVGWCSWEDMVEEWTTAEARESVEDMKTFVNTGLGESWKDQGEAPNYKRLYERRESYEMNIVPAQCCFLTCGVDVQKDRLEILIMGWARNMRNWCVDYRFIAGDTSQEQPWNELTRILSEEFNHENGHKMIIRKLAVDSGYRTQAVYNWARRFPIHRVVAIKGQDSMQQIVAAPRSVDVKYNGNRIRNGAKMFSIGSSMIKSELYGWLKMDRPGEGENEPYGFSHFPEFDEEFFKMLCAEELVKKKDKKGFPKWSWVKTRDRNEALDLFVMNRVCANLLGLDRMKDKDWNSAESKLGIANQPESSDNVPIISNKRRIRRKPSSGWLEK